MGPWKGKMKEKQGFTLPKINFTQDHRSHLPVSPSDSLQEHKWTPLDDK